MALLVENSQTGITTIGGIAVKLTADGTCTKGEIVVASTTSAKVKQCPADEADPIGVVYSTATTGNPVWVVVSGVAQVKLVNSAASTSGQWAKISASVNGRVACSAMPTGASFAGIDSHFREIGHCIETVAGAPTGALTKVVLHFN